MIENGYLSQVWDDMHNAAQHQADQARTMQQNVNAATGFGVNEAGLVYDPQNADSYVDAMNQMASWKRDDTYYQRLFKDLKAAGVNPAVLLGNGSGATGVNSASTYKSSSIMDARHKKVQENLSGLTNSAKVAGVILAILGAIAAFA